MGKLGKSLLMLVFAVGLSLLKVRVMLYAYGVILQAALPGLPALCYAQLYSISFFLDLAKQNGSGEEKLRKLIEGPVDEIVAYAIDKAMGWLAIWGMVWVTAKVVWG